MENTKKAMEIFKDGTPLNSRTHTPYATAINNSKKCLYFPWNKNRLLEFY